MMQDSDHAPVVPDWITTYGDLMSLLLTFFVMLASMSELRETDKYHGVADSLQDRFGYDATGGDALTLADPARSSPLARLVSTARTRQPAAAQRQPGGPAPERAPPPARMLRPGDRTTVGTVLYFSGEAERLSAENQTALWQLAAALQGKPQKIEVRGHAAPPLLSTAELTDGWEGSYIRARSVMQFLVYELAIDPQRIRLSAAGPYEPLHLGAAPDPIQNNPRVEVFLLDELASDLAGTAAERTRRFSPDTN